MSYNNIQENPADHSPKVTRDINEFDEAITQHLIGQRLTKIIKIDEPHETIPGAQVQVTIFYFDNNICVVQRASGMFLESGVGLGHVKPTDPNYIHPTP